MPSIDNLLASNKAWSKKVTEEDPTFFQRLSEQQSPEYLWIGCADSRVPANQIVGLAPGELFVHRNVANQVIHTDFNCLTVVQYAIEVLKVKHIIICGHYNCGGVAAALDRTEINMVSNWIRHIKDIHLKHFDELKDMDHDQKVQRLCELNVKEQVLNLAKTNKVQKAWHAGQKLTLHGWIYSLENGILNDLNVSMSDNSKLEPIYHLYD